jgi:hypothetical protein
MRFITKDGTKFEVSNLSHVVINEVRRVIIPGEIKNGKHLPPRLSKKKERSNSSKGTRVWVRTDFSNGRIRWLKYHDVVGSMPKVLDPMAAQAYATHDEIRSMIQDAMTRPGTRLWFSGTYCNIEITMNWQEVRQILDRQTRMDRTSIKATFLPLIKNALDNALQRCGAQVRKESISTPFGDMVVVGTGRNAKLTHVRRDP